MARHTDGSYEQTVMGFLSGIARSFVSYFVSAARNLRWLLGAMMEAASAAVWAKKQKYNAVPVNVVPPSIEDVLVGAYNRMRYPSSDATQEMHAKNHYFSRVLTFAIECDEEDSLQKQWLDVYNALQVEANAASDKKMHAWILRLINEEHIRRLDFSACVFDAASFERFMVFLKELLDCNPNITQITLHSSHVLPDAIASQLKKHQALYMAERLLGDRTFTFSESGALTKEKTEAFFITHQSQVIERYSTKTQQLLDSVVPSSQRDALKAFENDALIPIPSNTPWGWIVRVGRRLKEQFSSIAERIKPSAPVASAQETTAVVPYVGSMVKGAFDSAKSYFGSWSLFKEEPREPWYFLARGASPQERLRKRVEEAERIVKLWDKIKRLERITPSTQEEMIAQALEKAAYYCEIVFNGLFVEPEVNMGFIELPLGDERKKADKQFWEELRAEKNPLKQKYLLVHPDKNVTTKDLIDLYELDAPRKKAVLEGASDILTNHYRAWLVEINKKPQEGGLPYVDVRNEKGESINAVQHFIQQFMDRKGELWQLKFDLVKEGIVRDLQHKKLMSQYVQLIEKNDQLIEKNDQLIEKNDQLIEKNDQLIEKSDELISESKRTNELLEQIIKHPDPAMHEKARQLLKENPLPNFGYNVKPIKPSGSYSSFFAAAPEAVSSSTATEKRPNSFPEQRTGATKPEEAETREEKAAPIELAL